MAEQLHVLHALKVNTPLVARLVLIVTQVHTLVVLEILFAFHVQLEQVSLIPVLVDAVLAQLVNMLAMIVNVQIVMLAAIVQQV